MEKKDVLLSMKNISKGFPGVKALDNVEFEINKGEIHALMGENGAGKSTLVKVLTGVHVKDSGTIIFEGKEINPQTTMDAQSVGISTVYQEVNLCSNLTVAENIYIGRQPKKNGRIDWKKMNEDANTLLQSINVNIDVSLPLSMYSLAIQQMVAIARAADISAGLLILDEPTSSLDNKEVVELFKVMRKLKDDGMGIVFITHFIDQVYKITDKITVLRNGKYVGTYETKKLEYLDLVSKMIGRDYEAIEKKESLDKGKERKSNLIVLDEYGKKGKIENVNLEIKKGEVLGLAGLLGSGRTEIAKLIFGIDKNEKGTICINNEKLKRMYPSKAISSGMGFCPEDRKVEGIIGDLTIRENIALALQSKRGIFSYIKRKEQEKISEKYVELLDIKTPSIEQNIGNLSGGNQQKVILARWLATDPTFLILDEPTRGIDIGSRTEIQKLIRKLADDGMTILLISSELEEIASCCDRVVVLRDRKIVGILEGNEIDEGNVMKVIASGGV
ncbi:sugar ABC transporter ATP-binding protein [Clostridium sp. DL1XJH146]